MAVSAGSQSQGTGLDCFTSWFLFPSAVDKPAMSLDYNPLILSSTGHAGDLGDAQLQSGGPRRSTCLHLPRILSLGGCHPLIFSGIHQSRGPRRSTCLNLPRNPILGRRTCLNLSGDSISRRLSHLNLGICTLTQGCLALRLQQYWVDKLQKDLPPTKSTHGNKRKPTSYGTVPGLINNSGVQ